MVTSLSFSEVKRRGLRVKVKAKKTTRQESVIRIELHLQYLKIRNLKREDGAPLAIKISKMNHTFTDFWLIIRSPLLLQGREERQDKLVVNIHAPGQL